MATVSGSHTLSSLPIHATNCNRKAPVSNTVSLYGQSCHRSTLHQLLAVWFIGFFLQAGQAAPPGSAARNLRFPCTAAASATDPYPPPPDISRSGKDSIAAV